MERLLVTMRNLFTFGSTKSKSLSEPLSESQLEPPNEIQILRDHAERLRSSSSNYPDKTEKWEQIYQLINDYTILLAKVLAYVHSYNLNLNKLFGILRDMNELLVQPQPSDNITNNWQSFTGDIYDLLTSLLSRLLEGNTFQEELGKLQSNMDMLKDDNPNTTKAYESLTNTIQIVMNDLVQIKDDNQRICIILGRILDEEVVNMEIDVNRQQQQMNVEEAINECKIALTTATESERVTEEYTKRFIKRFIKE